MQARPAHANTRAMSTDVNEEDPMISASTFFIQTACVAGISPLGADTTIRHAGARRAGVQRAAPVAAEADERFVEELLATFTDRWEW
jgi:hypothetical protein